MKDAFAWDPNGNQIYDCAELEEIAAPSFNKEPGSSFAMIAPAGTLTLLPSETSVWGGSPDVSLPPVKINLSHGALVMRAKSGNAKGVDLTIGPYIYKFTFPMVDFTIADATFQVSNLGVVNAGGVTPPSGWFPAEVNLDLKVTGTGRYNVDCREYLSSKRALIADHASMAVRAEEIVLAYSQYRISTTSSPSESSSLSMESTGGKMMMANMAMLFGSNGTGTVKSKTLTVRGMVGVAAQNNADVSFTTDRVLFYDAATVAQFDIADNANITFNSESGGLPFDFKNGASYPEGLFNFEKSSKGKFSLYGVGNAFDKANILDKGLVSVDDMPQHNDSLVRFDYVNGDMVLSLK